ncbi:homeodomain-interacting protein kinase 2-like [Micropterus dolomieu]|uniref:homeodomain-interacting protein kinase 2-like n=1 Tax=Micropterus dolomieu TaxID=147949 RepID=UPI001E8E1730|nr:homeodomain-interacting protein kinase 2-like [Micropterus dolomieu]
MHNNFPWSGQRELANLKELSKLDPDKNNLVRFNRHFKHFERVCLEYELLDKSLYDFMKLQHFKPLCLSEIRVITQQLLVALNALKSIGLAHLDISPEKVMLVNQLQSFKVKLIGFGAAGPVSTFRHGTTDQCVAYRAPEDLLGLPMNEASDMWALGCTLAFLYLGQHLYPTESEYEVMRAIVQMQGPPDEHMLKDGGRTSTFFACENYLWRLNDPDEYCRTTCQTVHRSEGIFNKFTSLDDMAKTHSEVKNGAEYEDTQAFLSLIKQMLQVSPEKRITPSEALGHSFVTMKHFHTNKDPYVTSARLAMEDCRQEHSLVENKPLGIFAGGMYRRTMRENCVLHDESRLYAASAPLWKGVTGQVGRCKLFQQATDVAVKMMHYNIPMTGKTELATLEELRKLDPDKNNLVRFNRHFKVAAQICLEYELLDINLYEFMKLKHFKPLCLSEIRVITQQLLVALNALKSIGLAHKDIKPQKVMLVNQLQSFKVKLIGFGAAGPISTFRNGTTEQCVAYRAPEDLLGLPMNEAIDMWALGCTLAFLYLGQHLYPTESEYEVIRAIVQMQGPPDKFMLYYGRRTYIFFTFENSMCRLNDEDEYTSLAGYVVHRSEGIFNKFNSLDDMAKTRSKVKNHAEYKDTQAFLSLIKQMLQVSPEKRITPSEALGHSFVTMKHFHSNKDPYVTSARLAMEDCRLEQSSVECKPFETSRKVTGWNGSSITKLDDTLNEPPATADIVTAGTTNNGQPDKVASAGLNDPNSAGTDEKAHGTNKAASPASVSHNSHEGNTNNDKGNTHFVEVKCRKKWLKKIKQFFSRMIKP